MKIKYLGEKKSSIAEELQSYEGSLRNYLRRSGKEPKQEPIDWSKILKKCRTHRERLIAIAAHNNEELKLSPAIDILFNGKFIKSQNRANAYLIIYGVINSMVDKGEFEKVDRGTYRRTLQ